MRRLTTPGLRIPRLGSLPASLHVLYDSEIKSPVSNSMPAMRNPVISCVLLSYVIFSLDGIQTVAQDHEAVRDHQSTASERRELIDVAIERLLELQNSDGAWPYEGVYRVAGKIPVGYRIGGTSIVCSALISADLKDRNVIEKGINRGTSMILNELEHRLMEPSRTPRYDVRIWGHIYALDFFCRLKRSEGFDELKSKTEPWIRKLADAVIFQEIEQGGWNYANKSQHCCFVTAPAVQSLLLAREAGVDIPDAVFKRALRVLSESRQDQGVIPYSGTTPTGDTLPGSIARGPITEATLLMLGAGDQENLQTAIDAFHKYWDELEKRRKKTGTHLPPHGIAPYYFYYGHRYAAQAIRLLPSDKQDSEFKKFETVLMKTKDEDSTWNDRVFDQSKAFGTAMSVLALSRDAVHLPAPIEVAQKKASAARN